MEHEHTTKNRGLTSFALHLTAMALMLCDHIWGTLPGNFAWLGYLGRCAFPLFAFLIAEGFLHTRSRKKYALRLFLFALISEIPFNLLMEYRLINPFHQNVLWTFLLSLGLLSLCEKIRTKKHLLTRLVLWGLATLAGYLSAFVGFLDYYGYGVLMVVLFYFTRSGADAPLRRKILLGLIQLAGMYWINCEMMMGMMIPISLFGFRVEVYKQGFALLALPLIWLYNGQQGPYNRRIRALYYWFYPAHMLILALILNFL